MTKIKLNDRVKHVNGRIGTVVVERHDNNGPTCLILWDDNYVSWHCRDDDQIAEVIGHRYFVDTPFTIGETYHSDGYGDYKVVGVGLAVESCVTGIVALRNPDGTAPNDVQAGSIIPPAKPKRTVTLELTDEQLEQVKKVLED